MLEEFKTIDLIEIVNFNIIQVREANIILKDGNEIAKTFHRYILKEEDDISTQDDKLKAIAKILWPNKQLTSINRYDNINLISGSV